MEEIVVDIEANGDVRIEGKGFAGADCEKATRELEEAIGVVGKRMLKAEYHRARVVTRKAGA